MLDILEMEFKGRRKEYFSNPLRFPFAVGEPAVVEAERGFDLGRVSYLGWHPGMEAADPPTHAVVRRATSADLHAQQQNTEKEDNARRIGREKVHAHQLEMKLVDVEFQWDGRKMTFYFTAEGRVDFRELVKDLVGEFRTRIEMRQIGVRHEAKMIGGLGCCGRELCCACFLKTFDPISVKMAKEQNLSLNPAKISGQCGRLMCCLTYEYDSYLEQRKNLPKLGKKINTRFGPGKVVRQNIMARTSTVALADGGEAEVEPDDILPNEPAPSKPHKKPDTEPEP